MSRTGISPKKIDTAILILMILFAFLFGGMLMLRTFGYDPVAHIILIDGKLWSDFGAAVPLLRSFSKGDNWPPQYPGFPGEPIRYHFGFYFLAGMLEKAGLRIDWALNIPSVIGFAGLMVMIHLTARKIFNSIWAGIISVIFFIFNGSLAFIKYFSLHPLSSGSLNEIMTNHRFTVFGPWDGGPITAFWTLNIYTNQRHLAFSYALVLGIILLLINLPDRLTFRKNIIVVAAVAGLTSALIVTNMAAALIAVLFMFWFFIVKSGTRKILAAAGLITLPWFYYIQSITMPYNHIEKQLGYLINPPLTVLTFLNFWFYNIGLHSLLIIIGMIISPKRVKILFIIPLLILFTAPNILKFSPDMINNHKFFNFFLIIGNMFSAYVIVNIFRIISRIRFLLLKIPLFALPALIFFLLILSGILDFFAVYNREPGGTTDIEANPTAKWIYENTPANAVFLNSFWFYHPANIAGRFIFSGYPYFTWSYGYDKDARENIVKAIYNAPDKPTACRIMKLNHISYVELADRHDEYFTTNWVLWRSGFTEVFRNNADGVSIYDVGKSCR
jgi:hypothetical protein